MELVKVNTGLSLQRNSTTGLDVINSFQAKSGFEYISGLRKFGDLSIIESVATGIGVTYLNNVKVFNENGDLIIDKNLNRKTHYTREQARLTVRDELLYMLEDAANSNGNDYDRIDALEIIDQKLKTAYYSSSYRSILTWAQNIGIELTQDK